jgi:hypothetical protein
MKKRTIFMLTLSVMLCMALAGCGSNKSVSGDDYQAQLASMKSDGYSIDYESAEAFETALNNGEDVLGKVVSFKVNEVHPDSSLGYDLWAGEHLNFVGEDAKEAKEGDTLTVAIYSTEEKLGSWVIEYDVLDLEAAPASVAENEGSDNSEDQTSSEQQTEADNTQADTTEPAAETETNSSLVDGLIGIGYSAEQADAIAEILVNVGIPEVDDMWNINKNGTLQANACTYKDHQINFTTDNGECFYVQITGWKEEISSYGWYRSAWSGKLKYGYNTQTKINTVDLYATDYDNTGYLAVYDAETDSVHPYGE